mgnify:CR=1 FL=1
MRHVRARRPLTMRFVNPCGRAAPRPDGALRVTVCSKGRLGISVVDENGRVVLGRVLRDSTVQCASGARLAQGIPLLAVDSAPTLNLEQAVQDLLPPA